MEKKTLAGEIEGHHGTTEHTSAQCGLCDLLFQRHLLHPCGDGGQPAAGALWVCLWNDRQPAVAAEHRQPAGWIPDRCAAGGVRRCHPDVVGRGHRVGKSRPCRWDGLQHRALRGAGAVHPAGGTPAGRIRAEGDKTELVRDRSYGKA